VQSLVLIAQAVFTARCSASAVLAVV